MYVCMSMKVGLAHYIWPQYLVYWEYGRCPRSFTNRYHFLRNLTLKNSSQVELCKIVPSSLLLQIMFRNCTGTGLTYPFTIFPLSWTSSHGNNINMVYICGLWKSTSLTSPSFAPLLPEGWLLQIQPSKYLTAEVAPAVLYNVAVCLVGSAYFFYLALAFRKWSLTCPNSSTTSLHIRTKVLLMHSCFIYSSDSVLWTTGN